MNYQNRGNYFTKTKTISQTKNNYFQTTKPNYKNKTNYFPFTKIYLNKIKSSKTIKIIHLIPML